MTVRMPRLLTLVARLVFASFVILTSIYCLLAYIPFTYQQVVTGGLFPWLVAFVKLFPFLYWVALTLVALTLLPELRVPRTKYCVIAFWAFLALAGIVLMFRPLLPALQNDSRSLVWCVLTLLPLFWLAAIDWLGQWPRLAWSNSVAGEEYRIFYAACLSALLLAPVYAAVYFVRSSLGWATMLGGSSSWLSFQWSMVCHLIVFATLFVVWDLLVGVSRLSAKPPKTEFFLSLALTLVLVWTVIRSVIFLPLSFMGIRAAAVAFAFAATLVAFLSALSLRMHRVEDGPIETGLGLLILLMRPLRSASWINRACFLLLIPGIAYLLEIEAAAMDWGFLAQKVAVISVWVLTLATVYTVLPHDRKFGNPAAMYGVALAVLGGYVSLVLGQRALLASGRRPENDVKQILDDYADFDISFRIAHELVTGSAGGVFVKSSAGDQFYSFLAENTDIPRSTHIEPVPVNLVAHRAAAENPKPNVFIFVIDSLRRDYLSPYNSAVTFTPSVDSFAKESVVMENAFTQYGGTGLSEPCIWAGAMLLHQEYTTPFYPMKALEKLLETEKYRCYISQDNILRILLGPSLPLVELDRGVGTMDLDLCRTTQELESKLGQLSDRTQPIFVYTQPQNIHVSVINREGRSVPPGEDYPGFDPAVASRLKRIDKCFGEFTAFLKKTGFYDNSIVILTSDHGDSLGEGGRMGHAYTIFPEVVRVPLIIHLPPAVKAKVWFDQNSLAFLTDITPSLYYLLGYRPIIQNGLFGRPLFTKGAAEQTPYPRNSYLMASSYGPVYGILSGGKLLYIADGVSYKDYLFDLAGGRNDADRPLNDASRADYREKIVRDILAVDRFYGFRPQTLPQPKLSLPTQ